MTVSLSKNESLSRTVRNWVWGAAGLIALVGAVIWLVWALSGLTSLPADDDYPAGRYGEPSGVQNVETACTDFGDRLYWTAASYTPAIAPGACR